MSTEGGMVYKAYREGRAEGVERRRIADAKWKEGEKAKIHAEVPVQPEFVPRKAEFLELSCRCYMPKKSLKVTL